LTREDAVPYRDFRLAALQQSPTAFTSSYAEERQRPLAWTRDRLAAVGCAPDLLLGAFDASDRLVGTAGLAVPWRSQERHLGMLFGMAVAPELFGQGIGRRLVAEIIDHAVRVDLAQVELTVSEDNTAAAGLYTSYGFRVWGRQERAVIVDGRPVTKLHMVKMILPDDVEDRQEVVDDR
jgi:ribosomal protein S18 acetylase RimI-like enzyme